MEQMRAAVERFCELVESAESGGRDFITEVEVALAELLAAAPRLASLELNVTDQDIDHLGLDAQREMMARLAPLIGPHNFYLQVYEPLTGLRRRGLLRRWSADHAVVGGLLTEDLASVWADLKPGLACFGGPSEDDALFDWQIGYESHWGLHAVSALYVLTHSLYF